jgi:hypothetical protein
MKTLIKAVVRIFIIAAFLSLFNTLLNMISNSVFSSGVFKEYPWAYISGFIAVAIAAVLLFVLWRKTDWVIRRIVGDIDDHEISINTTNLDLIRVAMFIFGIVWVVTSISGLIGFGYFITGAPSYYENAWSIVGPDERARIITGQTEPIIKFVVGMWLVFGNRSVVAIFNRILNGSQAKDSQDNA